MNVAIRLRRAFFSTLVDDLARPHAFAFERVGWVFARQATTHRGPLLLPDWYEPVNDEDYVRDDKVGARFGTAAIRAALQRARATNRSCLQVHLHDHYGDTQFSWTDCKTIDELATSFRALVALPHGGLVLSRDSATARIWLPDHDSPSSARVTIVGFPTRFGAEHP